MKAKDVLQKLGACEDAIEWVGDRTPTQTWRDCKRGDWMMWILAKHVDQKGWATRDELTLLACDFAVRAVKKYWTDKSDTRPMDAIIAARRCVMARTNENIESASSASRAAMASASSASMAAMVVRPPIRSERSWLPVPMAWDIPYPRL